LIKERKLRNWKSQKDEGRCKRKKLDDNGKGLLEKIGGGTLLSDKGRISLLERNLNL